MVKNTNYKTNKRKEEMTLTIKQLDEKMNNIEKFYDQFNMCSYEYLTKDKMYLGRLYQLKLKLKIKPQTKERNKNDRR
jgi:hypothetical protein